MTLHAGMRPGAVPNRRSDRCGRDGRGVPRDRQQSETVGGRDPLDRRGHPDTVVSRWTRRPPDPTIVHQRAFTVSHGSPSAVPVQTSLSARERDYKPVSECAVGR